MKIVRVDHHHATIEYRYLDEYVRRKIHLRALTEFLTGGIPAETNLGHGRDAVLFSVFVKDFYLLMNAKSRLKLSSFIRETASTDALSRYFGEKMIHEIALEDWETYKTSRLNGKLPDQRKPSSEATVIKEFKCMRHVLKYALRLGLIRRNILAGEKLGLVGATRADVWLKRAEIVQRLRAIPHHLRKLFKFMVWTGSRPNEAYQFGKDNVLWDRGEIWILNSKKKKSGTPGERKRYFKIRSLGPKFQALLRGLTPHPTTGLFFYNPKTGKSYAPNYYQSTFREAMTAAKFNRRIVAYDFRGTFCMHRAMVVKGFRQLQTEMGHLDPASIQSYLTEASHHDPKESIFFGVDASSDGPE
jgi:integrase